MIRVVAVVVCYAAVVRAAFSTNYEQGPLIKNGVPVDTPEVQAAKELHFKLYAQAKELADKQPSDGRYEGKEEKYHHGNAVPEVDDKKKYYSSVIKDVDGQKKYYHTAVENHHPVKTETGAHGEYKQYVQYYSVPIPTHYSYPEYTESKVPISTNTNYEHQYQEYSLENKVPISTKTNYDQQYQEYSIDSKVPVSTQANYDQYSGYSTSPQTSTTPLHQQQQHYEYRTKRDLYYQPHDLYQEIAITPYITRPTFEREEHNNENDIEYQYHHHEHIPVITKAGVPEETPAVKAAREQHHLAHHLAKTGASYTGGWSKYRPVMAPNGVPYDTPEVYREKLRHLAAHQEAEAKHHQHHEHHGHHHDYEEQEEEEEQEQEQEEY